MILFSNAYFRLDYEAATDVISLTLPDMTAGLSEARHCFAIMIEHVKNYHVSNLLLDSSNSRVEVEDADYHALIYDVSMQLKATRLKKVARVCSTNVNLEKNAVTVQKRVLNSDPATYEIQNFNNKETALDWLRNKDLAFS